MMVSLVIAILLRNQGRNTGLARNMLLIPLTVPTASVIAFWSLTFGDKGLLDPLLELTKMPYTNLIDSPFAFFILILLFIWKYSGYSMIMWLVGLNGIPKEYYENASLDGAGATRQFISITLPLIKPTALLVFVISLVNTFKVYREAYMLAGEYPNKNIYMLQHFMNNNFKSLNYQNLVMTSFVLIIAIIFIFMAGKIVFFRKEES
jgi:multiple sugar transport system permease protein